MRRSLALLLPVLVPVGVAAWWGGTPDPDWPTVSSCELELDVCTPGRFEARARLGLEGAGAGRVALLLNRNLRVTYARVDGVEVEITHGARLSSRYHREGRVVTFSRPEGSEEGAFTLELTYSGEAERGREGPDWRGILFVDADEVRMCEQTIFYPQVPLSLAAPAAQRSPFRLTVKAPSDLELYVPAPGGVVEEDGETRRWSFESVGPCHPALLGGRLVRHEDVVDGTRVVTLLREEHADLGPGFVDEASRAIVAYGGRFGTLRPGPVGVVEIHCRDSSYNWAGQGVMAFDRGALSSGEVPVVKVAHEVAHLWWGQAVDAVGPGERFLTEGLAEYSAWSYLERSGRFELVASSIERARRRLATLTAEGGSLALVDVTFDSPEYSALAYDKGALVLRNLDAQLDSGLDPALRELVRRDEGQVGIEDFLEQVARVRGPDRELRVPWIEAPGDLALRLDEVTVEGDSLRVCIVARALPSSSPIRAAGTPLRVEIGGRGWSRATCCLLEGALTRLELPLAGQEVAYVHLDPAGAWTGPAENVLWVLDGASLVEAEPAPDATVPHGGNRVRIRLDRPLRPLSLEDLRRVQLAARDEDVDRFELLDLQQSEDGSELRILSEPWLPGRTFELSLLGLRDLEEVPVAATYRLTTAPSDDRTPARIVSTSPAPGERVRAPGGRLEISITFDEPMQPGQAITGASVRAIQARGLTRPTLDGFGRWDAERRTITYRCVELEPGVRYALPVSARSFRDLSGNGCQKLDIEFEVLPSKSEGE